MNCSFKTHDAFEENLLIYFNLFLNVLHICRYKIKFNSDNQNLNKTLMKLKLNICILKLTFDCILSQYSFTNVVFGIVVSWTIIIKKS